MYKKILSDFSAGVNYALAPLQLGLDSSKTYWANGLNVEIFSRKGVCRQNGNQLLTTTPQNVGITSIYTFTPAANQVAKKILYTTIDGKFYEFDVQTSTHKQLSTVAPERACIFAAFLGGVAVCDGVNPPFFYKGDKNGLGGTICDMKTVQKNGVDPIVPTAMCAYKSRLWLAEGDTLYFSALGMFDDWETPDDAGYISNFHCDNSPVTALMTYKDYLAVYKKAQTYLLSGDSTDTFAILPFADKGATSPNAVVTADNRQFFFADALFCLEQTGILAQITLGTEASLNIKPVLNNDSSNLTTLKDNDNNTFQVGGALDKLRLDKIHVLAYEPKNQLWFYIPTQNNPHLNNIWIFDYLNKAWCLRGLPQPVSCAANYGEQIVSATSDGRILFEDSGNSFDNTPIQFEWKSPFLTLGNPNSRKIIDDFYLLISDTVDNNFDFRAYKDYDTLDAQDHEQISVSNSQNLVWAHENSQGNWVCWADDDSVSGSYALAQRWAIPCETAQKIDVSLSSLAVQFCISGSHLDQNFALLALEYKEITVD